MPTRDRPQPVERRRHPVRNALVLATVSAPVGLSIWKLCGGSIPWWLVLISPWFVPLLLLAAMSAAFLLAAWRPDW